MWMWRICFSSMESKINREVAEALSNYKNRQVVLNYYEEEELVRREGFHFEQILITKENELVFVKDDSLILSISLQPYTMFEISHDFFHNYKLCKDTTHWINIYFP